VPGYPSVARFNRDLAAYIRGRSDLVGDLPETATQGGQQTSTLFSDAGPLPQALKALIEEACRDGGNLLERFVAAAHAYCTLGEIAGVLREEFGEYVEPKIL